MGLPTESPPRRDMDLPWSFSLRAAPPPAQMSSLGPSRPAGWRPMSCRMEGMESPGPSCGVVRGLGQASPSHCLSRAT